MSNREKLQQFIDEQKKADVYFYGMEENEYYFSAKINGEETFSRELLNMFKRHDYVGDILLHVDRKGRVCATITNDEN